ncbi:SAM-dependent methyltransferase [Saccharothrix sp. 6-C]|uniref:SAM-dependent methyltransferase n=1 Tax=Saccharothrix sp. 6-C TaxID=2781735 RepID=UPI003FA71F0F
MRPIEDAVPAGIDFTSVADLGCGDATRLIRLCGRDESLRGIGIDISAAACDLAAGKVADAGLADRVEIVRTDVLDRVDHRVFPGVDLVASFLIAVRFPGRRRLVRAAQEAARRRWQHPRRHARQAVHHARQGQRVRRGVQCAGHHRRNRPAGPSRRQPDDYAAERRHATLEPA